MHRKRATDRHRSDIHRQRTSNRHETHRDQVKYTENKRQSDGQTKIELDIHRARATDRETKTESYIHRKRASDRQTSERQEIDGGYLGTYHSLDYKLQPFREHYSLCRIVWELDCCTVWFVSLSPHPYTVGCFRGRPSMGSILQPPRLHPGLTNDKRIKSRSKTF